MNRELRQFVLDDVPDDLMVEDAVAVEEDVAEGDDARCFRDASEGRSVEFCEAFHGFTDDLELTLDGAAQHGVGIVIGEIFANRELRNQLGRLPDVFQAFLGFKTHT